MPYTRDELKDLSFFTEYINDLRNKFITELVIAAKSKFRNSDNVFFSFEDIDTQFGIENSTFDDTVYSELDTVLSRFSLEGVEGFNDDNVDINPSQGSKNWIREHSKSIQSKSAKHTAKNSTNFNKLVDRSFSELIKLETLDELPAGLQNGDYITLSENLGIDKRKWIIENNQKRIFPDLASFYGSNPKYDRLKSVKLSVLDEIPDGEPVE
tara:strand:+ start:4104 stop:4736 length:633 start_codon:yes stop_codon:yes gene_type:complete